MPNESLMLLFVAAVFALTAIPFVVSAFFTVEAGAAAVVYRFGSFHRVAGPGLHVLLPFVETLAGRVTMRVQQLDVKTESQTKDHATVRMVVAVHYSVRPGRVHDAFNEFTPAREQIAALVSKVVRARVAALPLGHLLEDAESITDSVKRQLVRAMEASSYKIVRALVTRIDSDVAAAAA